VGLEHSRSLLLAATAAGAQPSDLQRRLDGSTVVVSLDPALPLGLLTARVLLTTLRRGPGRLVLERGGLPGREAERLEEAVNAVDGGRPLHVGGPADDGRAVRIHVGASAPRGVIGIVPDGYGAHVAAASSAVISPARAGNALGAVYTAALGATEAFKHTAGVRPARRVLHRHLKFCPVTLSGDLSRAPDLPGPVTLSLALIGVGAIGTGIALILSELPAEGALLAVDRQQFGLENRGTYAIGTADDAAVRVCKVELVARVLRRFDVCKFPYPLSRLLAAVDAGAVPRPSMVLTALDTPEARREAQRLWPDRLIDGATGDAMVGIHDHRFGNDPCLRCLFPERHDLPSGTEQLAAELGIAAEVLADGERLLDASDLRGLPEDQQDRLSPMLGRPICGLVRALGLTTADAEGFMPSAPFISLQAACLSVGRLLADVTGAARNGNFVQYDGLIGPQHASVLCMEPSPACYCSARAQTIAAVRARRGRA
jgi:hypothetical protein